MQGASSPGSRRIQVLANIPLAAMGSVIALLLTNWPEWEALAAAPWWQWPRVWIEATSLSVAHWVGFITLIGIVSRNGIMMISHYIHLMQYEGEQFNEKMIIRGSLERLAPVMMTAMTSFIGLLPLLFGAGQTGKEILYPLTVVVFGGMLASTILDQIVTPALFFKFGGRVFDHASSAEAADHGIERMADELFPTTSDQLSAAAGLCRCWCGLSPSTRGDCGSKGRQRYCAGAERGCLQLGGFRARTY